MKIPDAYKKPEGVHMSYGTAGFRGRAETLPWVMFRMGIVAGLRSKTTGAVIGVMITASHNPECDNGIKLIDPHGEMLDARWEGIATALVNASDGDLEKEVKAVDKGLHHCNVFCAYDTRKSSVELAEAAKIGVETTPMDKPGGVNFYDFGLLTTPQLHYIIRCMNTHSAYGDPTEDCYYQKLSKAFVELNHIRNNLGGYSPELIVDCANGVGAPQLEKLVEKLGGLLKVTLVNVGEGSLNERCGADFVKVQQCKPDGLNAPANAKCASLDGDADRLMYFYTDENGQFHLLDGDKICALFAGYIMESLKDLNIPATFGVVQTAYANGSSTLFMQKSLGIEVACVKTGVKHLHKKAEEYDVGVYFEANGHGTVLFSEKLKDRLGKEVMKMDDLGSSQGLKAAQLLSFIDLINETVGDALSDLLAVESVLRHRKWSVQQWDQIYADFPSRQLKVSVKDRNLIETTDAERKCVSPKELQPAVDAIVSRYKSARCFVRPSGTEDIVRVYAEADTQASVDQLAAEVAAVVAKLCG